MKPLHVALLVVGAALAGGLAVKMSQPPRAEVSEVAEPIPAPIPAPKPAVVPKPAPPAPAPVVITPVIAKTEAPAPIYVEPPRPAAAPRKPAPVPVKPPAPAKPVEVAKVIPPPAPAPIAVPAPIPYQEPAAPAPPPEPVRAPEPPPTRRVTLSAGTTLPVRLLQTISSEHAVAGDTFQATLADPLVVDGLVVAERGARVSGRIVDAKTAGRFSGTSVIQLSLSSIQTADGQRVNISTEPWAKQGNSNERATNDAVRMGGGAALGAIIGAIAGGGKGAAIGAGAGGAAGAGSVAMSKAKPLQIQTETLIRFRLSSNVSITERPL